MRVAPFAALLIAGLGTGCVATPLGTARTLAAGAVRNDVAVGATTVVAVPDNPDSNEQLFLVPMASWTMRTGLADGVELGVGAQTIGLHGDVKLALWRTDRVALAFAPGVAANLGPLFSGAAPLLLDLDLGRATTLVLEAAPALALGGGDLDRTWTWLGFGGGLAVRVSDSFAIQPGVHAMIPLHDGGLVRARPLVFGGLGLLFGPDADRG